MLLSLIGVRGLSILSDVMFCGMLLVAFLGLTRISYVKVYGAWPDNRLTRVLAFIAELFTNVVSAVSKARSVTGAPPLLESPEVAALTAEVERLRSELLVAHAPVPGHPLRAVTLPDVGARATLVHGAAE